jgi:alanine dehydrogenase
MLNGKCIKAQVRCGTKSHAANLRQRQVLFGYLHQSGFTIVVFKIGQQAKLQDKKAQVHCRTKSHAAYLRQNQVLFGYLDQTGILIKFIFGFPNL